MFAFAKRQADSGKHPLSQGRRRQETRAGYKTRLRFEPLEERQLLSVFTVLNTNDSGAGSLRQAILDANEADGSDTIQFASDVTGTIELTSGDLLIGKKADESAAVGSLTITGPGAKNLTIDAGGNSRVFTINNGNKDTLIDVTIEGVTITGGYTDGASFEDYAGGGVFSYENLTLSDVTVTGNEAYNGGGIFSGGAAEDVDGDFVKGVGNTTLIKNSTISGNMASSLGGGLYLNNFAGGSVTIQNSTISGNTADIGAGLYSANAAGLGAITIQNSTITRNAVDTEYGHGGGIESATGTVTLKSSIVALNTGAADAASDIHGSVAVEYSLIGNNSGATLTNNGNNLIGTAASPIDPKLGVLADNGGQTQTCALLEGSPAINAGSNPASLANDQRGAPLFVRVSGSAIDMGAYERQTLSGISLVVDTDVDENDGDYSDGNLSLREAISLANGSAGADTITFDAALDGSTISLDLGELAITDSVTIQGLGAQNLTIDADYNSRIFNINDGSDDSNIEVAINGLSLLNGFVIGDTVQEGAGGAIYSSENLTLRNSLLSGNVADYGGGIYVKTSGTTTIQSCTFTYNYAYNGGGAIYAWTTLTGTTTIQNSTISGNISLGDGGSRSGGGGIYANNYGTTLLQNSTVTGNTAESFGGGVYSLAQSTNVPMTIQSSIIADNYDNSDDSPDISGTFTMTNSLVSDNTGSGLVEAPVGAPDANGNLIGDPDGIGLIDAMLDGLADNGGPTETHALLLGSPAINRGSNPASLTNDQRGSGFVRTFGAGTDMGAYEFNASDSTDVTAPTVTLTVDNDNVEVTVTATDTGSGVPDGTVVALDVDLNNDGDFTDDGETGYTLSYLVDGETTFAVTPALSEATYSLRVRVSDQAGNEGSATGTLIVGSGDLHDESTIGAYNPATARFYLRNSNTSGVADITFAYGPANLGWISIIGDWDGNGTDTVGLYDPATARFFLRDTNSAGVADTTFSYGPANLGWIPIVGDWDGTGTDTVGLYDPATSRFFLRNSNTTGVANVTLSYGPAAAGWKPIVGNWDGADGDTIGLYNPAAAKFYLKNTNTSGVADITLSYGPAAAGWQPMAGDWDNLNGTDTVGLYNPATARYYLKNSNTSGVADVTISYGAANVGWKPLSGDWNGVTSALSAADGEAADADVASLTQSALEPLVSEAITRWAAAGLSDSALSALRNVNVVIGDLPDSYLGLAGGDTITIDIDAAGHGWFVDSTPALDEEFAPALDGQMSQAIDPSAVDRIDLLTVVEHELGHILGLSDLDALAADLMSGVLDLGARCTPSYQDAVDAALAS